MDDEAPAGPAAGTTLSPVARMIAVFARPTEAWRGLERRAQWWWPMALLLALAAGLAALLHERALVPMMVEAWEDAVAAGRMTAAQVASIEDFFRSPAGLAVAVAQQVIISALAMLGSALALQLAVSFLLGHRLGYRLALEVSVWSSLILVPAQVIATILGWTRETLRGVHLGFGILVPEGDPPAKLEVAARFFLDAVGPFPVWALAVAIVGAAALSGAPRRRVAWAVGGVYVVLMTFFAAIGAAFTPGR